MANYLKREKQIQCLHLLAEGNSIRSTERLTGVHRDTIMRTMYRFGLACARFLDLSMQNVFVDHAQLDEIWTFVAKKDKWETIEEKYAQQTGSFYLFTALCTDSKLLFSHKIGKRTQVTTDEFVADVAQRMYRGPEFGMETPQISTDGWKPYVDAISREFGKNAKHGVLIKKYVNPEVGRYAPPSLVKAERTGIRGIDDLRTIVTSHVERCNLTIRTFMKRFARLALGFSKKVENLSAATAIHVATYNFTRKHRSLDGCTPAMAGNIVSTLWSFEKLYDEVMTLTGKDDSTLRLERFQRMMEKAEKQAGV